MPLLEIKKRLQSTQDSKKITQALQLVAASKMKLFQKKAISSRHYAFDLLLALKQVMPHWQDLSFATLRNEGKSLFVLVTSNKGLCGTLNIKTINFLFRSKEWLSTPAENRLLITIGKKGFEAAKRNGYPVLLNFEGISEKLTAMDSLDMVYKILSYWEDNTAKEISIIAPHYVSAFSSYPVKKMYLPFSSEMLFSHNENLVVEDQNQVMEFEEKMIEPSLDEVLKKLSFQIIHALFDQSFYELKASEYSSRMVAMKKSTDAATDLISALTLEYNKARQTIITQQLAELATAAEAMEEPEEEPKPIKKVIK